MHERTQGETIAADARQHLEVLLTLAAGEAEATDPCPGPERFVALTEGKLDHQERSAMLTHLDRCLDCHRLWLLGAATLPLPHASGIVIPFWRRSPALTSLGSLALAASLLLVVVARWDPFTPDLAERVATSYRTAQLHGAPDPKAWTTPTGQKERGTALGFGQTRGASPLHQAFTAGARAGEEILRNRPAPPRPALDKDEEIYYHLGQWTLLLHSACQATPDPGWLRQQAAIGSAFATRLADRESAGQAEARVPRRELATMDRLLNNPLTPETTQRTCRLIQNACQIILESLSL